MKKKAYSRRIKIEAINEFQIKYLNHLSYACRVLEKGGYSAKRRYGLFKEVKTTSELSKIDADIYIVDMIAIIEEMRLQGRFPKSNNRKEYLINSIFKRCFDAGYIWGKDAESMAMNIAKINKDIRQRIAPVELLRMNKRLKNVDQYYKWLFDSGEHIFKNGKLVAGFEFDDEYAIKRISQLSP